MIYEYDKLIPQIADDAFIADSAEIIGDVKIGKLSSIWFQAIVRGDIYPIRIGDYTNIQDNVVVHVQEGKYSTEIGSYITIGHHAVIHGATLEDYAFIGMSSTLLDGVIVRKYGFVAAGALVPPKFEVPEKTLVAGVPAKIIRKLSDDELKNIEKSAFKHAERAKNYSKLLKKL
ncbi:MAG: gamma carbonic anhydrase family protein [Spirochaetia bacterium]|nr:gamma carbonic anhydrase family protein [Spirochaetia bacterium]